MFKQVACLMSIVLAASQAQAGHLTLLTEQYAPYNYIEDGKFKGITIDQVRKIMSATGIDYKIEFMTWARALTLAETQNGHCVFSTAHDEERDKKFKWVEPLIVGRTFLIRKTTSDVRADTVSEAKGYIVGTQRADFTHTWLEENGFRRIELAANMGQTYQKLLLGRIDMMPIDEQHFNKLKKDGANISKVLQITERNYGIACNKSIDDKTLSQMQSALDALIADGTQQRIIADYGMAAE